MKRALEEERLFRHQSARIRCVYKKKLWESTKSRRELFFLVFLSLFGVLGNFSFWCDSFSNKTALVTFVHFKKMKFVSIIKQYPWFEHFFDQSIFLNNIFECVKIKRGVLGIWQFGHFFTLGKMFFGHIVIMGIMSFGHFNTLGILSYLD